MQVEGIFFNYEQQAREILRPELVHLLNQADTIQRFCGVGLTSESIKGKTVKRHTLDLLPRVDGYIDGEMALQCKKMLLLHDLPETRRLILRNETADTTEVEKRSSSNIDNLVESEEMIVARSIFINEELELYQDFSRASDFVKDKTSELPTGLGLVAKILDKVDGDINYHLAASGGRLPNLDLKLRGQTLAFEQYKEISKILDSLRETELKEVVILVQKILNDSMLEIGGMWRNVAREKIPKYIIMGLNEFILRE